MKHIYIKELSSDIYERMQAENNYSTLIQCAQKCNLYAQSEYSAGLGDIDRYLI